MLKLWNVFSDNCRIWKYFLNFPQGANVANLDCYKQTRKSKESSMSGMKCETEGSSEIHCKQTQYICNGYNAVMPTFFICEQEGLSVEGWPPGHEKIYGQQENKFEQVSPEQTDCQTDTTENITFPQPRLSAVIMIPKITLCLCAELLSWLCYRKLYPSM